MANSTLARIAVAASVTMVAPAALATEYTVGLGAGLAPDYEGSDDYKFVPLWNFRADNLYHPDTYVQVLATRARSNLLPNENWRLGPVLQYIPERNDVHDNRVDDLQSVDASVMVGAVGGYELKLAEKSAAGIEIEARQDVSGGNGYLATLRGTYRAPVGDKMRFSGGIESTYASEDYMSSYFGINAKNSQRSNLDKYNADAGIKDIGLNVSLTYAVFDNFTLTGLGQYNLLVGNAADSPIVDDRGSENQFFAGLLVGYRF